MSSARNYNTVFTKTMHTRITLKGVSCNYLSHSAELKSCQLHSSTEVLPLYL